MKLIISLFCCLSMALYVHGQNEISARVLTPNQKSIDFAIVSICLVEDTTNMQRIITDQNGSFKFSNLVSGHYRLTVQMLGYKDWRQTIGVFEHIHLDPIILEAASTMIDEIQVVAKQSVLENHLGKKVLRIGKDLTAMGSNALEALDNIPSVTTTPKGQVQIRGNSNVIIYINGKATRRNPSTLKFIAVGSLEKIEIITTLSAKYDAEGVGGIINLVYKKDKIDAFKLELIANSSFLTNPFNLSPNGGINLTWAKEKISFNTNLNSDYSNYHDYINTKRNSSQDSLQRYENLISQKGEGTISNALIGCNLELDSTFSVALEINFNRWNLEDQMRQKSIFAYKNGDEETISLPTRRKELENELLINFTIEKKISKRQQLKFSLSGGGENEVNTSEGNGDAVTSSEVFTNVQRFLRSSKEWEKQKYYHGTIDYERPFFKWGSIETGIKTEFIRYDILQQLILQSDTIQLPDNDFKMDMQKLGIYILQKKKTNKLEYAIGLRLEQFTSKAFQETNQTTFTQNYIRLFPSLQLNYLFNNQNQTLGFNYTRRINRPDFFDLNPYLSFEDPLNLETGNPALRPEFADLIELNYHQEWKKISCDLTFYNRITTDVIQSTIMSIDNDRSLSTSTNIGRENRKGMEGQITYRLNKKFKTSGTVVLTQNSYKDLQNEISFNQQITLNLRLTQNWKLNNDWKIALSEIYRGPSFQIQEKTHGNFYANLGISKRFRDKRGSLTLSVRDIFNTRQYLYSLIANGFDVKRSYKWQTRQLTLGLAYKLIDKKN